MAEIIRTLEENRFPTTRESLQHMQMMKRALPELQRKHPQIAGLAFFGSRTVGMEQSTSDLDTYVFYDGTEASSLNTDVMTLDMQAAGVSPLSMTTDIQNAVAEKMHHLGLPIDISGRENNTIVTVDISPQKTDRELRNFISSARMYRRCPEQYNLACRFHLGVGEKLYSNRTYILDELGKLGAEGDKLFSLLMQHLEMIERTMSTPKRSRLPRIKHLPKTIAEARVYFALKSSAEADSG